jgi:RHS repeat-associated protein
LSPASRRSPIERVAAVWLGLAERTRLTQYVNSIDGTSDYTYDDTGQLTTADHDYQDDESYVYDDNGNRISGNGDSYTTGDHNRMTTDGTYTYSYDAEGNRTWRFVDVDSSGDLSAGDTDVTEYDWDHRNRLTGVYEYATHGGAATGVFEYTYDVYGRRIGKDLDNDGDGTIDHSEYYIYDGTDIVLGFVDTDGAGTTESTALTERYLWGPAVDQLLAQDHVASDGTSTTSWTLTDHLGSVRNIVSYDASTDTTTVDDHFVYDSFGNITTGDTSVTRYLYTSQEYDTETGQYYYDARYYDQTTGKFLTTDPIKDDFDNPYRYVSNSPTNFIDPTGLSDCSLPHGPAYHNCASCHTPEATREYYLRVPENPNPWSSNPTKPLIRQPQATVLGCHDFFNGRLKPGSAEYNFYVARLAGSERSSSATGGISIPRIDKWIIDWFQNELGPELRDIVDLLPPTDVPLASLDIPIGLMVIPPAGSVSLTLSLNAGIRTAHTTDGERGLELYGSASLTLKGAVGTRIGIAENAEIAEEVTNKKPGAATITTIIATLKGKRSQMTGRVRNERTHGQRAIRDRTTGKKIDPMARKKKGLAESVVGTTVATSERQFKPFISGAVTVKASGFIGCIANLELPGVELGSWSIDRGFEMSFERIRETARVKLGFGTEIGAELALSATGKIDFAIRLV